MATATVRFTRLIQDSQELGSTNEHMVSRVFYSVQINDEPARDTHVNVKQTVGSSFNAGPLEVSKAANLDGPMDHVALSDAVERYYRSLVAPLIQMAGKHGGRMYKNEFRTLATVTFPVPDGGATSW